MNHRLKPIVCSAVSFTTVLLSVTAAPHVWGHDYSGVATRPDHRRSDHHRRDIQL